MSAKSAKSAVTMQAAPTTITSFKGFDRDMRCRDYQFEVGKSYTHADPVVVCKSGFHACEHPLDVLAYYAPGHSRYAIVTQGGNLARHDDDSKIASSVIAIKAELTIRGLVAAAIEYTFARTPKKVNKSTTTPKGGCATSGYGANSATSGYRARAETSGAHAVAANAGNGSARAGESGAIFLVERNGRDEIVAVFASKVGENGILANTWYGLQDGKPMEVTP